MGENGLNLSDIAAVTNADKGGFGGDFGGIWFFAIIVLLLIGNGGLFGRGDNQIATQGDIQRAIDTQSIQNQNMSNLAAIKEGQYETLAVVKDGQINNLIGIRDNRDAINAGFANAQNCCCETNRNIDSVKFDMANYACAIQQNNTANTQKVLDMLSNNRMADMQNQINSLQLQAAMCGIPRISNFAYGVTPLNWCNPCGTTNYGCGCGCN